MTDNHAQAHLLRAGDWVSLPEHGAYAATVAGEPIRDPASGNVFLQVVSYSGEHRQEATYEVPANQQVKVIRTTAAARRGQREAVAALRDLLADGYRLPLLSWTIRVGGTGSLVGQAWSGDGDVRATLKAWSEYFRVPSVEETDSKGVTRGHILTRSNEVPVTVWGEIEKGQGR
jgi:hypothetical protein